MTIAAFETAFQKIKRDPVLARQEAFALFKKMGLPKRGAEDWKYIDFNKYNFDLFYPAPATSDRLENKGHWPKTTLDPNTWVFYNGHYIQGLTSTLFSIARISELQSIQVFSEAESFSLNALNRAFSSDGIYIVIPKNCILKDPIVISYLTETEEAPYMVHPQTTIIAEENSQATIIEQYISLGKSALTNAVTNISLEPGAMVNHIVSQQGNDDSLQFSHINVHQSTKSIYKGSTIAVGGKLNRSTTRIHLDAPFAKTEFYALEFGSNNDQIDIHLTVEHKSPECQSHVVTRSVVGKKAKSAFSGKIMVQKEASQTVASLENKNLLLSLEAEANTLPQLEIYNDNIQCSHGATIGHLDTDALFYLQSRGIPEHTAKQMLIDSFIHPTLQCLTPALLKQLTDLIYEY